MTGDSWPDTVGVDRSSLPWWLSTVITEDNPAAAGRVVLKSLRAVDPLTKNPARAELGEFQGRGSWSLPKRRTSFRIGFEEMRWKSCGCFTRRGSGRGRLKVDERRRLIEGLGLQTSLGSLRVRRKVAAHSAGPIPPINGGHSERSAGMTSMRAARAAGTIEATTAAAGSTNAERTTGKTPGIFTSGK